MAEPNPAAESAPAEIDLSGRQLGGYRVFRRLGHGAMAEVYLAEQASLRRQVALKVLRAELAREARFIQRFQFEARAAARLTHANIVQVYEVGTADGFHFLAQEYVPGLNLLQWMQRQGKPSLESIVAILRQTAAALAKAAEHGIVHRDIKPENLLLGGAGEVKVADFGLARVEDEIAPNLTQAGFTLGTPLYMSPEQVEGKPLDARSDLYSLGVTCYHLLTGEPPFRGETAMGVAVQHLTRVADPLAALRPDLPPWLVDLVERLMAKDPAARIGSARELLQELQTHGPAESLAIPLVVEGVSADPLLSNLVPTVRLSRALLAQQAIRPARRWNWAWGLMALLGLAAGLGIAWQQAKPRLLSIPPEEQQVQRMNSAAEQYELACLMDTPSAYASVAQYFPQGARYIHLAQGQQAILFLQENDFRHATELAQELVKLPQSEGELHALGLAVATIAEVAQGKPEAQSALAQLLAQRDRLDVATKQRITRLLHDATRQRILPADVLLRWNSKTE